MINLPKIKIYISGFIRICYAINAINKYKHYKDFNKNFRRVKLILIFLSLQNFFFLLSLLLLGIPDFHKIDLNCILHRYFFVFKNFFYIFTLLIFYQSLNILFLLHFSIENLFETINFHYYFPLAVSLFRYTLYHEHFFIKF